MCSVSRWAYAVAEFRLLWLAGLSADQCITRHISFRSLDSAMWQQEAREPRMVHRITCISVFTLLVNDATRCFIYQ
jgi:hypothetical protein